MLKFATAAVTACLLSSCGWPIHGEGGFDEAFRYSRFEETLSTHKDDIVRAQISRRIDLAKIQLDQFEKNGAADYVPAEHRVSMVLWGRVTRSFVADMLIETDIDLAKLETKIRFIQQEFEHRPPDEDKEELSL